MLTGLSWLVGALLGLWLLATVLRSIPVFRPLIAFRDRARLVPDWRLFARPWTADLVLLRRDLLQDGTVTHWIEVDVAGPRRWYNFLWNPELGPRRAFLGIASIIVASPGRNLREAGEPQGQGMTAALPAMASPPYLAVLQYLSAASHAAVLATQFMIVSVPGQALTGKYAAGEPGTVRFVSELHRVRPAAAAGQPEGQPA